MTANDVSITAHTVDVVAGTIQPATVTISRWQNRCKITAAPAADCTQFLIPGFVDSHIHIESSMLLPSQICPSGSPARDGGDGIRSA